MKVVRYIIVLCAFSSSLIDLAWATITFGSRNSAFLVPTNSSVNFGGATLSEGSVYSTGGIIMTDDATYDTLVVETRNGNTLSSSTVSGSGSLGSALILADNERLLVHGGFENADITINGATANPSIIEGYGFFDSSVVINGSCGLHIRWQGDFNQDIVSDYADAVVTLKNDLSFAPWHGFSGEAAITINHNGYRLLLGGVTTNKAENYATVIINDQTWQNARAELTGPIIIDNGAMITLATSLGFLNGNGNTIVLDSATAQLNNGVVGGTLTNVTINNAHYQALTGSNPWTLNDVTFVLNDQSLTVTGQLTAGTSDLFGSTALGAGTVGFTNNSVISLNTNVSLGGTWSMESGNTVNGNGNVLDLTAATIVVNDNFNFADIVLSGVGSDSFDNTSDYSFYLSNVTWVDQDGQAVKINGFPSGFNGCELLLPTESGEGDIFNNSEAWFYEGAIELLTDISLVSNWVCPEDCQLYIDGAGHTLNLNDGCLKVEDSGRLFLRNMVLTNVTDQAFSFNGFNGEIHLSNVTIKLSNDTDFSGANKTFVIGGPVTFITDIYTFTVASTSVIDGVTVYYDTLSTEDNTNVDGFTLVNGGRLLCVKPPLSGDISISATGSQYLSRTEYLSTTAHDVIGRGIEFSAEGTTTYDGVGRSLIFPTTTDAVFTVVHDTTVNTTNIVLEGLLPNHLDVAGALYFGDGTTIRLTQDWIGDLKLESALKFGTTTGDSAEVMVLDLAGFTIDLAHADAQILLRGGAGRVLRICNGRLLNLSGSKLTASQNWSKFIFENVEFVLSAGADYTLSASVLVDIQGRCVISGRPGAMFSNTSDADFTLLSGSTLTIGDGIIYSHNNDGLFLFTDSSSCLELIGSTFQSLNTDDAPLVLSGGTVLVDHVSTFDVGDYGINLDGSLDVQIRPSATIAVVGAGTLTYVPLG